MVANGLKEEVEDMVSRGIDRSYTSMNGIGYKEMYGHVIGETSFEDAVRMIKTNTHRYAVRQLTWFNNIPSIHWIDMDCDDAVDRIVKISSDALGIGSD